MKTPIWVYVVIVVISAAAGIAIAGIPDTSPREPTIVPPATTEAPDPLADVEGTSITEPTTTPTTVAPETTVVETTTTGATTTEATTTTTTVPLPERGEVEITVANGAEIGGVAGRTSDALNGLGYTNTQSRDGTEIASQTFIYAPDELVDFAQRLSDELGLPGGRVRSIDDVPELATTTEATFVVYVGTDIEFVLVGLEG